MFGVVLRKPFLCPIAFAGLLSGLELRSTTSALPGMLALLLGKWYMLAVLIAGVGGGSIVAVIVAILVLDIAIQGHNILVQSRMFQVDPSARSRLNTAFVTTNFVCGALGSALASFLWTHGGWGAVCVAGAVLSGFALTVWLLGRRSALVLPAAQPAV